MKHWHSKHKNSLTIGQRIADKVASLMGSWSFIIGQSLFLIAWIVWNTLSPYVFDAPPYVGLNLLLSFEAAFAAPFIMISQNRQADRDRHQAEEDYRTNVEAEQRIEQMQQHLHDIEDKKLSKIIDALYKSIP